jgi:protease PrsW
MTGIGLGLARQSNNGFVKVVAPLIGLLAAMMLHSLWNFSGVPLGLVGFLGTYLLVMVPALLGVLVMVFLGLRREGLVIRHYLTPELQSGLITRQQYDALGGGRISSAFRALSTGGFGGWRANARFSQAATELAFHRDRVQRGVTSVDAARREAAYVQRLRELRAGV